jgi:signal transduction histidine kinase/DNA-binding NarL/FixJ family response regulator
VNALAAKPPPQRVVVIDDTADLRDLLKIALTRGGFQVVGEAGDGQQGIDMVRLHRPDVVLLDLAMPVMDGIEALPQIRRLCPKGKIVVLSGFGAQHMSERAVSAGADGYVQKGAPLNTILDYVREVCEGTRTTTRSLSVVSASSAAASGSVGSSLHADKVDKQLPPSPAASKTAAAPSASTPGKPGAAAAPPAGAAGNVSAWEALKVAPYGVVELADEPLFRIVHANPMGARLLGTEKVGTPLGMVAAELASLVSYHRLDSDASFETDVEGGRVRATLRRTGWSILVFLDSAAEDVGLLRRAIATTAHEVRGPVAVLCGIAETLAWDGNQMDSNQQERLMASVARQARILDQITADLLTAAQIQRGTLRVDLQVIEPRSVVQGIVESRFDVEVSYEDPRAVRADPLRLEQMLTNLLSNAHKYGEAPFLVRVRPSATNEKHVCIDVIDHGEGVPVEFRDHLFREFARAHGAVATGTGLGLYVVRTLAHAQQGEVSYAPGDEVGSVFTIELKASE